MESIGKVYTLRATAKRLGKPSKKALKQAIYRLKAEGKPLEIGEFRFILIGDIGYIAIDKTEDLTVIDD